MMGPLVLLADSQLLFAGPNSTGFLAWLSAIVTGKRGVYVGASNGDVADYYQMGRDAFSSLGAQLDWQSMRDDALSADYNFYLLAGGDVAQGWRYLGIPAVNNALQAAREKGALFLGVSAGAMHLAHAFTSVVDEPKVFLGWMDVVVAVHEERQHWPTRQHWQKTATALLPLLCIPMGGGLVWQEEQAFAIGKGAHWCEPNGDVRILPSLNSLKAGQPKAGAAVRE